MKKLVISASECASLLATTPNKVQKLLMSGDLPAYKDGRNWKIPIKLLEQYVVEKAIAEAKERKNDG